MARLRTIKPEMYTNDVLAQCSIHARYMFPGLWCHADRRGILEDRPLRLKAAIFPYDNVDTDALLTELANAGFIKRYEVDGIKCILIVNFLKHQFPNVKEKPNDLPQPQAQCQDSASTTPGTVQAPHLLVNRLSVNGVLVNDQPNGNGHPKRRVKKTIPADWYPDEAGVRYAIEQGMNLPTIAHQVQEMIDWHGKEAKGSADVPASWRTWCRKFKEYGKKNLPDPGTVTGWAYPTFDIFVTDDE